MSEATAAVGRVESGATGLEEGTTIADVINRLHHQALSRAESAIEDAIECGQMLSDQKSTMKHGEWQKWVNANCEFSYPTAVRYMRAASAKRSGVDFSTLGRLYGPDDDGTTKASKDEAKRKTLPTPTQIEADIDAINLALEEMQLPLMSADAFVSEAGTEFLTKKANERLQWLVDLWDMFAGIENTPS